MMYESDVDWRLYRWPNDQRTNRPICGPTQRPADGFWCMKMIRLVMSTSLRVRKNEKEDDWSLKIHCSMMWWFDFTYSLLGYLPNLYVNFFTAPSCPGTRYILNFIESWLFEAHEGQWPWSWRILTLLRWRLCWRWSSCQFCILMRCRVLWFTLPSWKTEHYFCKVV